VSGVEVREDAGNCFPSRRLLIRFVAPDGGEPSSVNYRDASEFVAAVGEWLHAFNPLSKPFIAAKYSWRIIRLQ